MSPFKPCLIIPVYDHAGPLPGVLKGAEVQGLPCFLVDDGSGEACARAVRELAERFPWVIPIRQEQNNGKGSAVKLGLFAAEQRGFSHAVQIDADGQHDTADLKIFLELAKTHPEAVILGQPIFDASMPRNRYYARYLTHLWVWINTLSFTIRDALCGYRAYPVAASTELLRTVKLGDHMEFDVEILVRLYWQGVTVVQVPTKVTYPKDGISHFRLFQDNVLLSRMQARLFLGMLRRLPALLTRHMR